MLANFLDRFRALALSLLLISAFAVPALAGPFEDAIGKFAADEYSETEEAIGVVATSGNPLAFAIVSALQDGRLSADPESRKVFITEADGKIVDAATGAAVAKLPDGAAAVRLNNKLRRHVEAALGALTLQSFIEGAVTVQDFGFGKLLAAQGRFSFAKIESSHLFLPQSFLPGS